MRHFRNLLLLRGERPGLNDWEAPLADRLGRKRAAVLNYGPHGVKVGSLRYTPAGPCIDRIETHPGVTDVTKIAELLHVRTDCGGVVVGFGSKVRTAFADSQDSESEPLEMRSRYFDNQDDPSTLRQFLPGRGAVLEATVARPELRDLDQGLAAAGLTVMRLQLTSLAVLNAIVPFACRRASGSDRATLLVVADQGGFTCLLARGEEWLAARGAPIYYLNPAHPTAEEKEHLSDFFGSIMAKAEGLQVKVGYVDSGVPSSFDLINRSVFQNLPGRPEVLKWEDEEFPHLDLEAICHT